MDRYSLVLLIYSCLEVRLSQRRHLIMIKKKPNTRDKVILLFITFCHELLCISFLMDYTYWNIMKHLQLPELREKILENVFHFLMGFFALHLRWIWGNISFDKTHGRSVITSPHNALGTQPDTSACLSQAAFACKLAGFRRTACQPVREPPESLHTSHLVWTFVVEGIISVGSLSGIGITSASQRGHLCQCYASTFLHNTHISHIIITIINCLFYYCAISFVFISEKENVLLAQSKLHAWLQTWKTCKHISLQMAFAQ